ncbi:MAG TPA: hypothetical protein VGR53_03345 [Nitrososphaerales archaeon]|nr:hypothetical protein [Nitrososphaerales archaeon]
MRGAVFASIITIALVAGAGIGYLVGISQSGKNSTPQTTCTILGETIGVALHVVATDYQSHSAVPVVGARISGDGVLYCNSAKQVSVFLPNTTNSTGWVDMFQGGGGEYYLNVTYPDSKSVYSLSVPVRPLTVTYATINISSGNVTIHFCQYGAQCSTA